MRAMCRCVAAAILLPAAIARAQEGPEAEQEAPSAESEELSAEDLAAIEAATEADAAALEESAPAAAPAPAAAGPPATAAGTQSMNPDIGLVADLALAAFSDEERQMQTGGHDPTANGFALQQVELTFGANVDPYFRFDANIVFGLFEVEVEEAYGTTLDLPAGLQVRLGQFLTRFGRMNPTHPHAWAFVDQPFALGRVFGGEGNRGLGLELSWLTPLPWFVELVSSATMLGDEGTARSFDSAEPVRSPLDLEYVVAAKQFFPLSDDWSLFWGLSGAFGPNGTGRGNRTDVYGTDVYLKWRPITYQSYQEVSLQAELLYRRRQVPEEVLSDFSGYAQVFWRFERRWAAALRYGFGSPARGRGGQVALDPLDTEWISNRHRVEGSLSFFPTEFSRLRLQGTADVPTWEDEPIYAGLLQVELVIGAHGAHPF